MAISLSTFKILLIAYPLQPQLFKLPFEGHGAEMGVEGGDIHKRPPLPADGYLLMVNS